LPPTPRILTGEQVTPTSAVKSVRTTPSKPSRVFTGFEDAGRTLLQHWIGPVLHCEIGVLVGCAVTVVVTVGGSGSEGGPPGMAAARMGRTRIVTVEVSFMIEEVLAGFCR
jgi:hypothetical protein